MKTLIKLKDRNIEIDLNKIPKQVKSKLVLECIERKLKDITAGAYSRGDIEAVDKNIKRILSNLGL